MDYKIPPVSYILIYYKRRYVLEIYKQKPIYSHKILDKYMLTIYYCLIINAAARTNIHNKVKFQTSRHNSKANTNRCTKKLFIYNQFTNCDTEILYILYLSLAMPHLNLLLQILLKTYFFDSRCIFIFTDTAIDLHLEIPVIHFKINNSTLNSHMIFQHHGCQDILIHHENASDLFIQFENLIRIKTERFNGRKYIATGRNSQNILDTKELEYVSDLIIIVPKEINSSVNYEIITHLYAHKNKTKCNEPVLLDIWYSHNYSFMYGNHLFPNKLLNQFGRQFRIGTFTYEPYSITGKFSNNKKIVKNFRIGTDDYSYHGTETSLVYEFVRKYNLTPSFTIIGEDLWGDIYDNWTGIGLLGSVLNDKIDIGYGK